jgi:hypothetical protein
MSDLTVQQFVCHTEKNLLLLKPVQIDVKHLNISIQKEKKKTPQLLLYTVKKIVNLRKTLKFCYQENLRSS